MTRLGPEIGKLLWTVKEDDVVVVSHLARSTRDLPNILAELMTKKVGSNHLGIRGPIRTHLMED
jgi:hypothetical protein